LLSYQLEFALVSDKVCFVMKYDRNQILENTAIQQPVLKLASYSCENEDTELINSLIDFYMLNIGELSSLLNQVLNDLSVIEKKR